MPTVEGYAQAAHRRPNEVSILSREIRSGNYPAGSIGITRVLSDQTSARRSPRPTAGCARAATFGAWEAFRPVGKASGPASARCGIQPGLALRS
jgi:hypothetical protein